LPTLFIRPDNKRLVEIWNSLPGVTPVTKFGNRKVAAERIWKAIQGLGEATAAEPASEPQVATTETETALAAIPEPEPSPEVAQTEPPVEDAAPRATAESALVDQPTEAPNPQPPLINTQVADVAPVTAESSKTTTPAQKAPKAKKVAKGRKAPGPAKVARRPRWLPCCNARTAPRCRKFMEKMGWQKHTVRGFMAAQ
jgi:hypothetical protein